MTNIMPAERELDKVCKTVNDNWNNGRTIVMYDETDGEIWIDWFSDEEESFNCYHSDSIYVLIVGSNTKKYKLTPNMLTDLIQNELKYIKKDWIPNIEKYYREGKW